MCSGEGDRTLLLPGFPIRKSSDHSSVGSSPRLIAASYVLYRLLVPRHPPCALTNLATKMLASTVQFSSYGRSRSRLAACFLVGSGSAWTGPSVTEPPCAQPCGCSYGGSVSPRSGSHFKKCGPAPSGPNSVLRPPPPRAPSVPTGEPAVLGVRLERDGLLVSVPPLSPTEARASSRGSWTRSSRRPVFGAP